MALYFCSHLSLSICALWDVAAAFPQLNPSLTTVRSVCVYSSAWKSQLSVATGQATSNIFLWRLVWVCPCTLQSFSNPHVGRSKNGWRKEGAARHHCSLFSPLPSLQGSVWSGLSGSREDVDRRAWRWDQATCSNPRDKDRNTSFPALDGALVDVCVWFALQSDQVAWGIWVMFASKRDFGDSRSAMQWLFQRAGKLAIFKVVLLNTIFRNKK